MLDRETKRRIDTARDILVGKVPDPKSQVEQITIALIYKFMDDMDAQNESLGGKRSFFIGDYKKYGWTKLMAPDLGGFEVITLYSDSIQKMNENPNVPQLFRDIFKNAFLPYRAPETLKSFLKVINDFQYDHSEMLGDAFEYLLSVLGSQGEAGQFRTPRNIIDFMIEVVDPKKTDSILDPACGTAGFLISAYKHILKHNSSSFRPDKDKEAFDEKGVNIEELTLENPSHYKGDKLSPEDRGRLCSSMKGYDISPDMVRLSLVNLYLHGFPDPHIFEYDTLTSEDRWNEFYDVILANPPFMSPKGGIKPHKRFSVQAKRSEVLFVDYIAEHLTPTGKAAVIVPEGIIFQSGIAYKQLRKMLVDDYLYAVVSLPAGLFNPYSGVKTSILLIDRSLAKKSENILFVKIENDGFDLGAQRRPIDKNDLPQALKAIREYKEKLVSGEAYDSEKWKNVLEVERERIGENGEYNLSGDRYKANQIVHLTKYELVAIGDLCTLLNGRAFKPSDWSKKESGGLPIVRIQNLNNPASEYNYFTGEVQDKNIVEPSELLFSWSGSRGTSFGAHIWQGQTAVLNQHIFKVLFDKEKALKKYLYYALNRAVAEVEQNLHGGVGLVHITKGNLEKIKIPLPPLEVQKEIVAEIEGHQKIIDGARQVVENYKPQIKIDPEWEMVELGEACTIKSGGTPERKKEEYWNGEIPWLGSTVCKNGNVSKAKEYITELGLEKSAAKKFKPKTTLIALVGATIGKTAFLNFEATTNQNIAGLYPVDENKLKPEFLFFISQTLYPEFLKLGEGKFRMANLSFVRKLKIPFLSLETQNHIVAQIEKEQELVNANNELIEIFEQKIKDKLASVWGE